MFLVLGVSLITAGVTLRVLGKVDYGLYSVVGGVVAVFSFLNGALAAASSRNITYELGKGDLERVNQVFNVSLVVFLGLAFLIVILSETIGLWFFYEKMVLPQERVSAAFWALQMSILSVPINLTQVPYGAVIIAHENMKIYAWVSVADAVARLVIIYGLLVSPFDKLITLSALYFGWNICTVMFYRVYCMRRYEETKIRFCNDQYLYKGILQYAGSDLIGQISCLAQGQGLNLLLNVFFGPVVNAARGIAYNLQGMTTQFSENFMTAVVPQIIKSYAQGDVQGMWHLVKWSSRLTFYLVWLLALPALLEGDYVLRLWLGDYPEHTLTFFGLILVVCLLKTLKMPLVRVFHACGKIFVMNATSALILCLAFPLAYWLLDHGYPPESVFVCTIVTMAMSNVVEWLVLRHYVGYNVLDYVISVYGRCILVVVVSSTLPFLFYARFLQPSFLRLIMTTVMTSSSVVFCSLFLGLSRKEREQVYEFVVNKMKGFFNK